MNWSFGLTSFAAWFLLNVLCCPPALQVGQLDKGKAQLRKDVPRGDFFRLKSQDGPIKGKMRNLREKWVWKPQVPHGVWEALVFGFVIPALRSRGRHWQHHPGVTAPPRLPLGCHLDQGSGDPSRKAFRSLWVKMLLERCDKLSKSQNNSAPAQFSIKQHSTSARASTPSQGEFSPAASPKPALCQCEPLSLSLSLQAPVNCLSVSLLGSFQSPWKANHCGGRASPGDAAPELLRGRGWGSATTEGPPLPFGQICASSLWWWFVLVMFGWRLPSSELVLAVWGVRSLLCSFCCVTPPEVLVLPSPSIHSIHLCWQTQSISEKNFNCFILSARILVLFCQCNICWDCLEKARTAQDFVTFLWQNTHQQFLYDWAAVRISAWKTEYSLSPSSQEGREPFGYTLCRNSCGFWCPQQDSHRFQQWQEKIFEFHCRLSFPWVLEATIPTQSCSNSVVTGDAQGFCGWEELWGCRRGGGWAGKAEKCRRRSLSRVRLLRASNLFKKDHHSSAPSSLSAGSGGGGEG